LSIRITNGILHILDSTSPIPVLSGRELELDGMICEFINRKIEKFFEDDNVKNAAFSVEGSQVRDELGRLLQGETDFLNSSVNIAGALFDIMLHNSEIPTADLLIVIFDYAGRTYYGVFKLNYKLGTTHFVDVSEEGSYNTLITHRTLLPADSQKIDEGAVIDMSDFSVRLLEKEYNLNGSKCKYFSELFLQCGTELSNNEKVRILERVTNKINRKYFDEDLEVSSKIKQTMAESVEEQGTVDIAHVADTCFGRSPEVREEYIKEIFKAGIQEPYVEVPEKVIEKKFRVQKIKTDTGVEINFPPDYYENTDKIEFINNPDGTISIIIKNVGHIENK